MENFVSIIEYCLATMQTISNTTSPWKHSIKQQTNAVWNILIALPASATLLPPLACCHRRRRAAVNEDIAYVFIVVVVAVIIAVSVTVAAAAVSWLFFFCPHHRCCCRCLCRRCRAPPRWLWVTKGVRAYPWILIKYLSVSECVCLLPCKKGRGCLFLSWKLV